MADNPELTANLIAADLQPDGDNYFSGYVAEATAAQFYKFEIGPELLPDPAARAQHGGILDTAATLTV